jgi:hypothetical protein
MRDQHPPDPLRPQRSLKVNGELRSHARASRVPRMIGNRPTVGPLTLIQSMGVRFPLPEPTSQVRSLTIEKAFVRAPGVATGRRTFFFQSSQVERQSLVKRPIAGSIPASGAASGTGPRLVTVAQSVERLVEAQEALVQVRSVTLRRMPSSFCWPSPKWSRDQNVDLVQVGSSPSGQPNSLLSSNGAGHSADNRETGVQLAPVGPRGRSSTGKALALQARERGSTPRDSTAAFEVLRQHA